MNTKKNVNVINQERYDSGGERKSRRDRFLCLIVFLFTGICAASVLYVNAAENTENFQEREETVPVLAWTGGEYLSQTLERQQQEKMRIRMANEDGIPVVSDGYGKRQLSSKEYGILTRIVEAEATGLDQKSKILVANVVLNRMESEDFPDTVEEVVFQKVNGATQFSPVSDGRFYKVNITDSTIESVDRALAGEDYSQGALYFMNRSISNSGSRKWFDRCLTRLFQYEGHEFFK